jgi:hypothetical protein
MKTLLPAGQLIRDSWHLFIKTWNESTKVSMWFLYFALGQFALAVVSKLAPDVRDFLFPLDIALVVCTFWASIRMVKAMLQLEAGHAVDVSREGMRQAWKLVLPMLWIGIIQIFILLGGFLLLILPGIYLAVAFTFSQILLIDQDKRGFAALQASRHLVKGRWWQVFWRLFAGSFVFGILSYAVIMLLVMVVAFIVGPDKFFTALRADQLDPMIEGILSLLQGIVVAGIIPLAVGFQVKLYRAVKE